MIRVLSVILISSFLTVAGVQAQNMSDKGSDDKGLYIGVSLLGTSLDVPELNNNPDTGGGLALKLGYNFNTNFAAFINLDGSEIEPDRGDNYTLGHVDLGAEGRLGARDYSFRPFFRASVVGMVAQQNNNGGDVEVSGGGFGLGAGVYFFASENFALELGYTHSWININEVKVGRVSVDVNKQAQTGRLMLGALYHF